MATQKPVVPSDGSRELNNQGLVSNRDGHFLQRAIALGEQARGRTGDNPWVGCVIVKEGQVIGQGSTGAPGEPHAEAAAVLAAEAAGYSLEGATVYCTLEPCSFHGRTPSCAKTLVSKRVGKIVLGIRDPHPRVDGAGIKILTDAGIEVEEGRFATEIQESLSGWLAGFE